MKHSYTIMPIITSTGELLSPLFVLMKEPGGQFPLRGIHVPPNIKPFAHTSSIMTKEHLSNFIREILVPAANQKKTLLIVDSWPCYNDRENIKKNIPNKLVIDFEQIPPNCTPYYQPLDAQFFRTYKSFVRKLSDRIIADDVDVNLSQRENILKMQVQNWCKII